MSANKVAVVLPCYRVTAHILPLLARIGPEVWRIYAVDDCCPDGSGELIRRECADPRVVVLNNQVNLGVGGAVMHGYRVAASDGADVIVKVDGDGQMAPELIQLFTAPILSGAADYTKGNRFFNVEDVRAMPVMRLIGNAGLSFLTKISSGYWQLFDPTNGYTAIHAALIDSLPLSKISNRYFFETDMLFRLNSLRAKVVEIPMRAIYAQEKSNLSVARALPEFFARNLANACKRVFYDYLLRDFSIGSVQLLAGTALSVFGLAFGAIEWIVNAHRGSFTSTGTVMLAVLPILSGLQLLLAFISYDILRSPAEAVHKLLLTRRATVQASATSPFSSSGQCSVR